VIDKPWAKSRLPRIGQWYQWEMCGFEWANGGGKAVKLVGGGRIPGLLERRIREFRAIIQPLELWYEIKGRVSSLEIFQQCDSGRRVVNGKITWGLVPDSDS